MNREEARALLEGADMVCTADEARAAVARLAGEITARLQDEFPLVLSVMGGAVILTGQLLPQLGFPLEFSAIQVSRYRNSTSGSEIEWRLAPGEEVRGRAVLVIDDILDEGITLRAVRDRLLAEGAGSVHIVVFADKDLGREKPVAADFVGVRVPDRYVFGFGMDVYGLWRNLPAVYALKG